MYTSKNNLTVLVGDTTASRTGSVQITNPSGANFIADGEIVILDGNMVPITGAITAANTPKIKLVQRSGATATTARLKFTPWIYASKVVSIKPKAYAAAQEQIYVLGSNGTTGSIDVTTDLLDFILDIRYTHDLEMWSEQSLVKPYLVPYVASIPQSTVAASFTKQVNDDPSALVKAEMMIADAGTAITGTGTITVANGSKTITAGTDIDAVMAIGDYIRLGATSVGTGVYKIVDMNTTAQTATLDCAFQGTSLSASAEGNHVYWTAANAATEDCGVKFTGKPLIYSTGIFKYMKTKFKLLYKQGLGSTTLTKTQEASLGNGVYEQVADLEWFAKGSPGGALNRHVFPMNSIYDTVNIDATSGSTYGCISIDFYDNFDMNSTVAGGNKQPQQLMIFLGVGAGQNEGSATDVADALEGWTGIELTDTIT